MKAFNPFTHYHIRISKKRKKFEARRISIDQLFAEPFEPRWMKWQRETKEMIELEERQKEQADFKRQIDALWRLDSARSTQRILERCVGHNYM